MTVLDTSVVVDHLIDGDLHDEVTELLVAGLVAAPDVIVLEVISALRRAEHRGDVGAARASGAIRDLGDLSIDLFPSLALRERAWELRDNLTAADALFVALAERLDEPLVTKDAAMSQAAREHTAVESILLGA